MSSQQSLGNTRAPGYGSTSSDNPQIVVHGPNNASANNHGDIQSGDDAQRFAARRRHGNKLSISEFVDELDRFGRRTISVSSSHLAASAEVSAVLGEIGDERSLLIDDESEDARSSVFSSRSFPPQPHNGDVRNSEDAISNTETIIHILKGNIGMGVLTLPVAIKNSGLVFGSIGLAVIAYICVHCMKMLVGAAHKALAKRPGVMFLDYADTAEAAFTDAGGRWAKWSKFMRNLVNIFLCFTQFGSNAVYVLFIAQNMQPIINHYFEPTRDWNYRIYIAIILLPMIFVCMIRNLKYLSPFSVVANIFQFTGVGIIFYYIFATPLPPSDSVPWIASSERLPLFFGTAIFAIEGISVVLPIENQMRSPKDMLGWNGVLNTSMAMVAILYVGMGFFGYLKYGEAIDSSITLNLPPGDIAAQVCLLLFSLAIFFSYALQFYVLIEILGPKVIAPRVSESWFLIIENIARILIHVATFALAATVPWLDLLVALLGAVKMSTLAIMAPVLVDTATRWQSGDFGPCGIIAVKNVFVFSIGLLGMIIGTYISLLNIIDNFANGENPDNFQ